ncbi:MAG: CTP synthase (UTP-ammonia lyase) [Gammaproteobacteria bacterium]|jgi:CTP synthase (UTP-ammonia lyase)
MISELQCTLVEVSEILQFQADNFLRLAYDSEQPIEDYHCSYRLNSLLQLQLFIGALRIAAPTPSGDIRVLQPSPHPFDVMTLFQRERAPPCVTLYHPSSRHSCAQVLLMSLNNATPQSPYAD